MLMLLLLLVALLALANGANDNCKGVATLVGYGAASPRKALLWAMGSTAIGTTVSFWFADGLIQSFSTGLFARGTPLDSAFFAAVLIGAFGWVIFATISGLPVSTTHAITGALTGAGLVAFGMAPFQWHFLGTRFAVPLALSPALSMAAVYCIAFPVGYVLARYAARCVCVRGSTAPAQFAGAAASLSSATAVLIDDESSCREAGAARLASTSAVAHGVHWFSSGMVGFARGWNDAPKIAALALGAVTAAKLTHGSAITFAIVTVAMSVGGLVAGRKVLETLAKKVTTMPLAESLAASLITSTLVSLASWQSLPVSTTQVSAGAIVGAGLKRDPRGVRWGKVGEIFLSWVLTLPAAGLMAAAAKWAIS